MKGLEAVRLVLPASTVIAAIVILVRSAACLKATPHEGEHFIAFRGARSLPTQTPPPLP